MSDRAGPPTPRNDPWTPLIVDPAQAADASRSAPGSPAHTPERDAAWVQWLKDTGQYNQGFDIGQRAAAKSAFAAGWSARGGAQIKALDNRTPAVTTLFPTEAELGK